ncbi:MAG: sigma-70 family RNA polymerase sigma factor [Chloroflexi bacterium]|nr:MAG: sigma-70 family RNA polymerase sigma factor [Chloroflexota bacterium]TME17475.1 MAG: sigma-70 family RNA polymerase sigma factor [Chloroflexota bacterium]TME19592.1 MAG: sigma-70 family RNA polymerase sigma factor [Chloroflexota bacterium]
MSSRALPDERSLVERAKTDPGAFGELYDRYFHQMYRFVFSRMRDQTAAEDVTSEVFIKALKGIPRYQDTGRPFVAWLYQIAVNTVADRYRSSRPTVDIDEVHDIGTAGPSLEDLAVRRDEVRQVWAIVEKLPAPQRTAIVLKFQEDMKITDIAAVMGKTEGAVKLLIHRGMTRIRGTLVPGAAR